MNKKLIAVLIVLAVLLAAAIGVVVYLESSTPEETKPGVQDETVITTAPEESSVEPSEEEIETTEETVGISLPTEDPDDVTPEETFGEEDEVPPVTVDPDVPATTEDPDANETPEDTFPG